MYYAKDSQGVMVCFCQIFTFMKYLQKLIMLAEKEKTNYTPTFDEIDVDWSKAESFDAKALLEKLKQCVVARYDENRGLILSIVHICYANQNTSVSFVFKTRDDGALTVSDGGQGCDAGCY